MFFRHFKEIPLLDLVLKQQQISALRDTDKIARIFCCFSSPFMIWLHCVLFSLHAPPPPSPFFSWPLYLCSSVVYF